MLKPSFSPPFTPPLLNPLGVIFQPPAYHCAEAASYKYNFDPEIFWMDMWSDPTAVFTGILTVATCILAWFTYRLWQKTGEAVADAAANSKTQGDDMRASLAEASRSAAAMEGVADSMKINAAEIVRSVRHQETFGKAQLRAYLSV